MEAFLTSQNFQSLACQTPVNDLALKVTLNPNQNLPIVEQDLVTFEITIYNQGEVTIDEINLVNYMSSSVYLKDDSWTLIGNSAYKTIKQTIQPGTFITTSLQVEVDDDFDGEIRTAAEIESAISNNFTDNSGNPIPLPDIDSQPDDNNSEINIVDNEINGGGLNKYEDEDDHDITYFEVGARFYMPESPCYAVAHNNGNLNALTVYDKVEQIWQIVGTTGTTGIKALAINHTNNLVYAVDKGILGTIDTFSGNFTPIGTVNTGNGYHGILTLDNIYGLAFDASQGVLYASHRITGNNDVIFQIDPLTGLIIPNAMIDSSDNPADYALIPTFVGGVGEDNSEDITDLTINPFTGKLYVMIGTGNFDNHLSEFDKQTIDYEITVAIWGRNEELGTVTFISEHEVYTTLYQPNGETQLVLTNLQTQTSTPLGTLDKYNTITDFLSLGCSQLICVDEKNISETYQGQGVVTSGIYQAGNTINSDGIINSNKQNVTYKAGTEINLESGFEVKAGSDFFADIEDCE